MMKRIPEEICRAVREAERVALFTHIHPDGDAIGSLLGFAEILRGMGKEVFCYLEEPVSYLYRFLPGCDQVNTSLADLRAFVAGGSSVIAVSLDCGDCDRLGKHNNQLQGIRPFLVIDHHRSHRDFGEYRWVEPNCSSTGEMVYELARRLGAEINSISAYNLYAAISTDTGSFRYESTTSRTLRIVADLVDLGVRPEEISGHIHDNYTVERIRLMEMVLATLNLYESGRLAVIQVTREMFEISGALPEDIEGFIDFPRSISTVKVAAFVKEGRGDMVSVSLRAKGECDVAEIAKSFGGGGHRNAAGFRFTGRSVEQVHQIVIAELIRALPRESEADEGV